MDVVDRTLELYKMEYEKAAERYDNIYRSIWTIFSYMTAVAAGVLAYGADKVQQDGLVCIAAIPLLFWFVTTYLPLDRYGTETLKRLGQIEITLNGSFGTTLNHFKPSTDKDLSVFKGLWKDHSAKGIWKQIHRARCSICAIFVFLLVLVIWEWHLFSKSGQRLFLERPTATTPAAAIHNVTIDGSGK